MFKRFLFITAAVMGVGWLSIPTASSPEIVEVTPEQNLQPTLTSGVAFKDRIKLPNNMLCPEWSQLAVETGWQEEDLAKLDSVIHRESRCYTAVHYAADPYGGSYGLTQVNAFWCKPSTLYPTGYLQAFGILETCEELYNPRTNLLAARLIWIYSSNRHGDGWLPWQT